MTLTPPGACAGPGDLDTCADWIPPPVPGTAAAALRDAARWSEAEPTPIHDRDVWYRTSFTGHGRECLRFDGLATLAEVWLNGVPVLSSRSMFLAHEVDVDLCGENDLAICFRSLATELARPNKRGRWRPRLATPGSLRHVRTSLLGFMPGWCPNIDAVGPYRPITRIPLREEEVRVVSADLRTRLGGDTGRLSVSLEVEGVGADRAVLRCDGRDADLSQTARGRFEGELALPGVEKWWPHTHGAPRLHAVEVEIGSHRLDLGRVGFRSITLTRPFEEGLGLAINGVPVFCRGASWMPADLVGLSGEAGTYRPLLDLAREAGMNMLRVSGITLYESPAFHGLCDELGILVWQDLMLANFDYPTDDPAFRADLVREIEQLLDRTQSSPSLCVIGGGSEVWQQAAMLGYPREVWAGRFVAEELPGIIKRQRPDLVVVPNSPSGGDLPFSTSAGVTHYYGVGAYKRPFEDARRAEVGFATECLAFANVPEAATLAQLGLTDPTSERWSAGIPRDRGADWDFEGVRDHYLAQLYGVDADQLRREDPERYLMLARATSGECMETTFSEWRRARSPTAGGLVWFLRDLGPGAGWGVVDVLGQPKPAWYALKRAFRSLQLGLSDEGLNGLHLHVQNETAAPVSAQLRITFTDAASRVVASAERAVELDPRASQSWSSTELLGRFFDATDAYRFGPPAHVLGHASLLDAADGTVIAEAFHFPQGRDPEPRKIGLAAELVADGAGWALRLSSESFALSVQIEAEGVRASDNWFHLAPGATRLVPLVDREQVVGPPRVTLRAINGIEVVRIGRDGS
nr:glycoside hydrolase family 2 protein [Methylobacterium brachythecii]